LIEPETKDLESFYFDFFKRDLGKMANHPIQFPSPPDYPISQFCEESSVERSEMPVAFKGISEQTIRMKIRLFNPVENLEADRPRGFFSQNLPVLAISSSLAIRSSIGGWVLKRERTPPPLSGLTMNIWAVEGLASMGIRWAATSNFPRALAKERGWAR
jgi:hypothetical protein